MTTHEEHLAAIHERLNHIDKTLSGPPTLDQRVTRLEERLVSRLTHLDKNTEHLSRVETESHANTIRTEVTAALSEARSEWASELRGWVMMGIAAAGALSGSVAMLVNWVTQ